MHLPHQCDQQLPALETPTEWIKNAITLAHPKTHGRGIRTGPVHSETAAALPFWRAGRELRSTGRKTSWKFCRIPVRPFDYIVKAGTGRSPPKIVMGDCHGAIFDVHAVASGSCCSLAATPLTAERTSIKNRGHPRIKQNQIGLEGTQS